MMTRAAEARLVLFRLMELLPGLGRALEAEGAAPEEARLLQARATTLREDLIALRQAQGGGAAAQADLFVRRREAA